MAPAPWRSLLATHLSTLSPPLLTLSTLSTLSNLSPFPTPFSNPPPLPRARTVVFRGFLAHLPDNPRNPAPLNPPLYTSDILIITTDARMDKIGQLGGTSGLGGPFEGVVWVPEEMVQWRVRGKGYLVGRNADGDDEGDRRVRETLTKELRKRDDYAPVDELDPSWSLAREVTAIFGSLSPLMRGTFRNPPPGRPRSEKPKAGEGLGQSVEDLEDEVARINFRVVGLIVDEVDFVDLGKQGEPGRKVWRREEGEWREEEVWP